MWKYYGKFQWNFHCFRICRHPNSIRKGDVGPRDEGLFEGETAGCQCSFMLKETKAFLMPQALRIMLTSSWCDWSCWIPCQNETGRAKSPSIFSSLSQSVNSLFCVNERLVCCWPVWCPVTVQQFPGSEWCTWPDEAHWGTLRGFPIKAVQRCRDQGIWLGLEKKEGFLCYKCITGTLSLSTVASGVNWESVAEECRTTLTGNYLLYVQKMTVWAAAPESCCEELLCFLLDLLTSCNYMFLILQKRPCFR